MRLRDEDAPIDQQIVAVLHDIVEDTPMTLEFLEGNHKFSRRVLDGVDAMTRRKDEDYFVYIDRLKTNKDAVAVKLKDLEHNCDLRRLAKAERSYNTAAGGKKDMKDFSGLAKRYAKAYKILLEYE